MTHNQIKFRDAVAHELKHLYLTDKSFKELAKANKPMEQANRITHWLSQSMGVLGPASKSACRKLNIPCNYKSVFDYLNVK